MKWYIAMAAVLGATVLMCRATQAATLVTDADSYVDSRYYAGLGTGNKKHGGDAVVQATDWGGPYENIYLHFNLSSLNAGDAVTSAYLRMNRSNSSGSKDVLVFALMNETLDWNTSTLTEANITWNTAPQNGARGFANEGSSTKALGSVAPGGDMALDVTSLVQYLLGQNAGFYGTPDTDKQITIVMRMNGYTGTPVHGVVYYSKETTPGDDSDAPRLDITQVAVPEPATLCVLAFGGLSLAGAIWRRRR